MSKLQGAAGAAVVAALYILTAKFGFLLAIPPGNVCAVWFPSGIALAALLCFGSQVWPGIWLGSFIVNTWFFIDGNPFSLAALILSFSIATGSTLQAWVGSFFIQKRLGPQCSLDQVRNVLNFVGIEAVVCTIAASTGIVTLVAGGFLAWSDFFYSWFTWWTGDLVGVILMTPLVLQSRSLWKRPWTQRLAAEAGILMTVTLAVCVGIFGGFLKGNGGYDPVTWVLMAPILWAAFRFDSFGVSLCAFLISACAIVGTMNELGPFSHAGAQESFLILQAFVGFVSTIGLSLAAVIAERAALFGNLQREVEERARAQEELQKAKERAEEASQAKTRFLANISHELRTPLNAIIGMVDILAESRLSREQNQYLQTLSKASGALMDHINDLLDLAKIEAGKVEVQKIPFHLEEIVAMVEEIAGIRASRKKLKMVAEIKPDVPRLVIGDPGCLRHILLNLLINAVKFTDRGQVALTVERQAPGNPNTLRFTVSDTGVGVPHDQRERIFEAFTQGRSSAAGFRGGSGLGLTIVRHLVGILGGRLWLESREGEGSRFSFTVSFEVPSAPLNGSAPLPQDSQGRWAGRKGYPAAPKPQQTSARILLVEDSEDNQQVVVAYFKNLPYQVDIAENGQAALDLFRKRPYDLVLMDMQMPVMDGYQATAAIRLLEKDRGLAATPVLALTAYALKEEMSRCFEAGCNAHLAKPIRKNVLLEAVLEYIQPAAPGQAAIAPRLSGDDKGP